MRRKKKGTSTIKGIILPAIWDDNGNVKGISIYTNDEKEYHVEPNSIGTELLKHIPPPLRIIMIYHFKYPRR